MCNHCVTLTTYPGLQAAQVHMIFKLPEELGELSTPLAYVQWFRKFKLKDPMVGMYKVSLST